MKSCKIIVTAALFVLSMVGFIGCDLYEPSLTTFGESAGGVPNLVMIPGANNVSTLINYEKTQSFLKVSVQNIEPNKFISDGLYFAWCLQMDKPITTGEEYKGTKLYTGFDDSKYRKLNYLINRRFEYPFEELSWKEIQVAIWVILETEDLQLESIANNIPPVVNGYNEEMVNFILADIRTNGNGYQYAPGDKYLVIVHTGAEDQDVGLECETAWMRGPHKIADHTPANHWGMFTAYMIEEGSEIDSALVLKNGPGDSFLEIGRVTVETTSDEIIVTIIIDAQNDWMVSNDVHLHIAESAPDQAPGQFPFDYTFLYETDSENKSITLHIPFSGIDKNGNSYDISPEREVYVAVHMGVCQEAGN